MTGPKTWALGANLFVRELAVYAEIPQLFTLSYRSGADWVNASLAGSGNGVSFYTVNAVTNELKPPLAGVSHTLRSDPDDHDSVSAVLRSYLGPMRCVQSAAAAVVVPAIAARRKISEEAEVRFMRSEESSMKK